MGLVACAVVALAVAAPTPAQAFLGGIKKAVGGLLGGATGGLAGDGGAGGGCVMIDAGLPRNPGDLGRVVGREAGGGAWGALGGMADSLYGEATEGCPVVESEPGLLEKHLNAQKVETVLQTVHMLEQIRNMVAMRARSGMDSAGDVVGAVNAANAVIRRAEGVVWNLGEVTGDFDAMYPEEVDIQWDDAASLAAHQDRQDVRAREASRLSKLVTANAVTGLEGYGERLGRIAEARAACEGQTCMMDVSVQQQALATELEVQRLMVEAAGVRAAEAQRDYDRAARERAAAHRRINRAGLSDYGG